MIKILLILLLYINNGITSNCKDIIVEDLKGEKINIFTDNNTKTFIVFYNNYCCIDCHKKIFKSINQQEDLNIVILLRTSSNAIINKKNSLVYAKSIFGKNTNYYFDLHDSVDPWPPKDLSGGLFGKYNITKTPALIYFNNSEVFFYSYEELNNMDFSVDSLFTK